MPVKRRVAKTRKALDSTDIEDMHYGPGTCLIGGLGYLGPHGDGLWQDAAPEVQAAVLETMRVDWERQWPAVMDAWRNRTAHELYLAREFHGDPAEPWALTQFGQPGEGHDRP